MLLGAARAAVSAVPPKFPAAQGVELSPPSMVHCETLRPTSSRAVPVPRTVPGGEIAAECGQPLLEKEQRTNAEFEEKRGGLLR